MEKFLLLSHASSGAIVLAIGLINMVNRKGGKWHALLGKIYVGTMWWICLSALLVISFYRFSFFLMVIAVLTFYSTFVGIRVIKRKSTGREEWYDWVVAGATMLFGIGLIGYGCYAFYVTKSPNVIGFLSLIFGGGTAYTGFSDLRRFKLAKPKTKNWWIRQHMSAMGGSYIAAITAFAVQNSNIFLPQNYTWVAWLLPTVIISPMLSYFIRKQKNKMTTI
ncbi:MAG: hypothetical protein RIA69_15925 [Cyclobacteriaceae bacterium]